MLTRFIVDDIEYIHPDCIGGGYSVYVRPIVQIYNGDQRLAPMHVNGNSPKKGLMDSEVDEDYLKEYWS